MEAENFKKIKLNGKEYTRIDNSAKGCAECALSDVEGECHADWLHCPPRSTWVLSEKNNDDSAENQPYFTQTTTLESNAENDSDDVVSYNLRWEKGGF